MEPELFMGTYQEITLTMSKRHFLNQNLMSHSMIETDLDLPDLLDRLELDEQDNWIDPVLVQPLHRLKMDVQHAMLALLLQQLIFKTIYFKWCVVEACLYPVTNFLDGSHSRALVV